MDVKVIAKLHPNKFEKGINCKFGENYIQICEEKCTPKLIGGIFPFNKVLPPESTNIELYDTIFPQEIQNTFDEPQNTCIFAMGNKSSGKVEFYILITIFCQHFALLYRL